MELGRVFAATEPGTLTAASDVTAPITLQRFFCFVFFPPLTEASMPSTTYLSRSLNCGLTRIALTDVNC